MGYASSVLGSILSGSPLVVTIKICVLTFVAYRLIRSALLPRPIPGIPYDPKSANSVLGDIPGLARELKTTNDGSSYFAEMNRRYGPICQIFMSRARTFVLLSDAQEIEDIVTRRTAEFDRAALTMDIFAGTIPTAQIALPTNALWKTHRRVVGPAMTSAFLARATHRVARAAKELVDLWSDKLKYTEGRPFDIRDDLTYALTDEICDVTFGAPLGTVSAYRKQLKAPTIVNKDGGIDSFGFERPQLTRDLWVLFQGFGDVGFSALPNLSFNIFVRPRRAWRTAYANIFGWIDQRVVAERKKLDNVDLTDERADTVVELCLFHALKSGASAALPPNEMRDELFQFVVAGSETTGATLSAAIKVLGRHPAVQERLRQSLMFSLAPLEERLPSYEDVQNSNLAYLDAVVYEVLRYANTAGACARRALCDTTILGHFVPKGTTIMCTLRALHDGTGPQFTGPDSARSETSGKSASLVNATWGADAHLFRPERWLNPKDGSFDAKSGPWLPFSAGQRGCYGKNLAMLGLKVFITTITLSFFLERVPPELDSDEVNEILTRTPRQAYVRPRPWDL